MKPGKLTPAEFMLMSEHCELGAQVLRKAESKLEFQSFLRIAIQIALTYHEKWDGSGYPAKVKGEEIAISGRIMALADVYDALRSERNYKSAIDHTKCVEIIDSSRGTHFDPDVVDAFLRTRVDCEGISFRLADWGTTDEIEERETIEPE